MIDMHTHILPGVDDGAKDMDEAIAMLKLLIEGGISTVVLTPHVGNSVQKVSRKRHQEIFEQLKQTVFELKLPISLILGAEVKYKRQMQHDYHAYTIGQTKYLLIEFSTTREEPIEEICYNLLRQGLIPIIAHAERYEYLTPEQVYEIRQEGTLIQVNISGLLGQDGKACKKRALQLRKNELVDYIASDCHRLDYKRPDYSKIMPEGINKFK